MVRQRRQQKLAPVPTPPTEGSLQPGGAWSTSHVQFGTAWVLVGLLSYVTLSVLARAVLHSPQALQQLQAEVPACVYDRSLFVFGTAFLLDVLELLFELKSSRLDVVLLPAFVKGAATLTNVLMRSGWAAVAYSSGGRVVVVQRLVCWMHTTPTLLVLVKIMAANITRQQAVRAVVCVEVMCLTGLAGSLTSGWWTVFWGGLSHLAFLPLLPYLHRGLKEASAVVSHHAARPTTALVYYLTMCMWTGFGVVWDLAALGLIDTHTEEVAYLCCDFSAKVMFSAGLMLSSFKGLDSRREEVMRQIQDAHKQTLILELRRAIEQKDVFMSSVSHELRTPLNGIIGISEGLLANCCGPLTESVRKQLFIVRTSGARLLALINDVMDAATLRQRRLVLKQERLQLRQVVGDVVDLTRSLVDADVSLRNDVPEGLEVWADSGRIIQILNNLLGNAAKFTHHGFIRVSARWHDEQQQWLLVSVTDTGIGIPKQKLASIFLPFEQVDGSISRQYGGFGLGLSITQELVKAHGGELWVKSRERKGSQFAFTIPSFTGQKPLTPQQQQALQLQSRRSMLLPRAPTPGLGGAADAGIASAELPRRIGSSQGLLLQAALSSAAPAAEDGSGKGAVDSSSSPHDTTAALANGAAAAPGPPQGALSDTGGSTDPLTSDLLASIVCEEYDTRELPYDAAQLSALASSKPFTAHQSTGSSGSGSASLQRMVSSRQLQHAGSMLSLSAAAADGDGLGSITPMPHRDQRPSQFACTGRYQILSVDDDPINQTVVRSLLASTGYEVVCLYSGQQMLDYIERAEVLPDLVLLDMLMPDMSGLDVCRKLALRQPPLGVPVILVSALAEESSVVTGLDSGADDYITKPFRRAEFLARVRGKLQLAKAGEAGEQQGRQAVPASGGSSGSDQPVVMCVTDDEVNHIVLEGILQSQSYRYLKVSSGADALKLLEAAGSTPPHLVLLDAALADTTGLEVLQTLRLRFSQVALPVIMLTARHNEKAIVQALDAGANDYAVKPFRRAELLARIRMHLRSSQKAAAAAPVVERPSTDLSFAGDFDREDVSAELQLQRSVGLQQLSSVPLLVVQLGGVTEALDGATAEQACQLMGFIADCFDAIVEKYAVIKVDASDTSLTVAAPLSTPSNQSSARNSLQLPVVQHCSPGGSSASLHLAGGVAEQPATNAVLAGRFSATAAAVVRPALANGVLQLLQLAQELQACLGIGAGGRSSSFSGTGSPEPALAAADAAATQQSGVQQQGSGDASQAARPRTPLQMLQQQASQWWHGQLRVQVGVHVGPLTAGVVGRRRPRYRLMGPALQDCRQACMAAPSNCPVATAAAAKLLLASGFQGLQPLPLGRSRHAAASGGVSAAADGDQQLWVLRAGVPMSLPQQGAMGEVQAASADNTASSLLSQAAAVLAAGAVPTAVKPAGGGLLKLGSLASSAELPAVQGAAGVTGQHMAGSSTPFAAQQQQQPQPQQPSRSTAPAAAGAALAQLPGSMLPPLPVVVDPAVLQSQQLLLQELALLQQHLAAVSQVSAAASLPPLWGPLPALGPTMGLAGLSGLTAGTPCAGSEVAAGAAAASPAVMQAASDSLPAAAPAAEVVSATLSLQDWHSSPTSKPRPSLQQYEANGPTPPALPAGSAAMLGAPVATPPADGPASHGVQLGAVEQQQISLLQQELAAFQQQLVTALGCGPINGCVHGTQAPCAASGLQPPLQPVLLTQPQVAAGQERRFSADSSYAQSACAASGAYGGASGAAGTSSPPNGLRSGSASSHGSSDGSTAGGAGASRAPSQGQAASRQGRPRGQFLSLFSKKRGARK